MNPALTGDRCTTGASGLAFAPGRLIQALWLLALVLLLTACAGPQRLPVPGEKVWAGRLALRIDSPAPQSFSAGFELRGSEQAGELQLNSPLGNTLATVVWTPQRAELRQGDQISRYNDLNTLTTELSGTALPVGAMFSWLDGKPAAADGWQADLSGHPEGRIVAQRQQPEPRAELRIVVQP